MRRTSILILFFIAIATIKTCEDGLFDSCRECGDNNRCIRCNEGYSLNDGSCHKCEMDGCTECPVNARDRCTQCKSGYFLRNAPTAADATRNECVECTNGCDRCDNENTCIECYALYDLDSDRKCELDEGVALTSILLLAACLLCLCLCLSALIAGLIALCCKGKGKKKKTKTYKKSKHDSSSSSSPDVQIKKKYSRGPEYENRGEVVGEAHYQAQPVHATYPRQSPHSSHSSYPRA